MEINLEGIGKRFRKEWIFRNVDLLFSSSGKYALVGHNGSGKSTLLQIIANTSLPSEGKISYSEQATVLAEDKIPFHLSFSAPYQDLIEELTGEELYTFHFQFRTPTDLHLAKDFFEQIGLKGNEQKQVKYFSSGMKQRLRLALCVYTQADVYLFDEPTTNLDRAGSQWYKELIAKIPENKTVIISSNIESEYAMCENIIQIADYKKKAS